MCGIGGILISNRAFETLPERLKRIQGRMRHRGPDDEGLFLQTPQKVGLVHARLSILDLSSAGHQPMATPDGRYVIVFNGEIYNFREIKHDLESAGVSFQSNCDTEVILRLYAREGRRCVEQLQGMFAFAIWDTVEQRCFVARDPLGIKPLYIWKNESCLAFASEFRAVLEAELGPRQLNSNALKGYLLFGSVQEPETLVQGITMLPAGTWLEWHAGQARCETYWKVPFENFETADERRLAVRPEMAPHDFRSNPTSLATAIQTARSALMDSVRKHYVSDVPVNLFLSGGIDSTALLGLSKTCGFDKLRTFSISFDDAEFNEGDLASRTAKHFHTDHHDWRMRDVDGQTLIGDFLNSMDQPSNDGFNTYCVSKFAHELGGKVVLSGLGGDELFGGYPSFQQVPRLQNMHRYASIVGSVPRRLLAAALKRSSSGRNQRLAAFLKSRGHRQAAYWTMRGFFLPEETLVLIEHYTGERQTNFEFLDDDVQLPMSLNPADAIYVMETTRYMRNQLLRDSDVMSMAWGLELRVPFVDRLLTDAICSIPASIRLAKGKQLLLDAVSEIPEWIRQQPKKGFRFPFDRWISQSWGDVFQSLDASCPVALGSWYRRWSLFTLEHFLRTNNISSSGRFALSKSY